MPKNLQKAADFTKNLQTNVNEENAEKLRRIVQIESLILLVLLLVLVLVVFVKEEKVLYFTANEKKEPELLIPMITPNHTAEAILSWVGSAAADILNFGFHNIDMRMNESRRYFTDDGWESFVKAVEKSGMVKTIIEKQQVLTAAPVGAAVIVDMKEDPIRGTEWTVQIPFTVTVVSGKTSQAERRILTLIIVRMPPDRNLQGLGIDNWVEYGS